MTSDGNGSGRSARIWLWPLAAILIILFGVAVGISYSKIAARLTGDGGTEGGVVAAATSTATAPPEAQATVPPTVAEATPGPTPVPTVGAPAEGDEPQATAVPLPCATAPDAGFESLYNRAALGCATAPASIVWAAWEPFERGQMLWRSDTDAAYVLGGQTGGEWAEVAERWDGASEASRGSPPPGLQAPVRGFGYVWGIRDDLYRSLGWATDDEKGFCAAIQSFESGFILQSSPVASCTADGLYNRASAADWRPLTLVMFAGPDRRWSVARPDVGEADDVGGLQDSGSPGGAARAESRPQQQGIFRAARLDGIRMDGNLDDWRGPWFPINHIVYGAAEWFGTSDLDGEFQARWSEEDLIVAVRVRDERYRGGPPGTNMWQGDGLELHFDRLLAADFDDPESNADDYQIGIGIEPGLNNLPGYRWLPYDGENSLAFPGALRANPQGLTLEVAIPWTVFDVQPAQIAAGQRFGFNLSLNDNDGDVPAQQTTASASPARTNHQTPTQWGTLVLVEGDR